MKTVKSLMGRIICQMKMNNILENFNITIYINFDNIYNNKNK